MNGVVLTYGCRLPLGRLLDAADNLACNGDGGPIGTEHVLLAMLHDPSMIPAAELRAMRLDPAELFTRLAEQARRIGDGSDR